MARTVLPVLAVLLLTPVAVAADAATENRLRDALRTTTAQLRTAEDELARARAAEASQKKEVETLRRELAEARRKGEGARTAEADATLRRAAAEAQARLQESLARCEAEGRASADAARAAGGEKGRLEGEVKSLEGRLAAADARSVRLYRIGKSIIDWLYSEGVEEAVQDREPFLGLSRVRLENAAQAYDDQLFDAKVKP